MIIPRLISMTQFNVSPRGGVSVLGKVNVSGVTKDVAIMGSALGKRSILTHQGIQVHVEREADWRTLSDSTSIRRIDDPADENFILYDADFIHWGKLDISINDLGLNKAIFIEDVLYYQLDFNFSESIKRDVLLNSSNQGLASAVAEAIPKGHDIYNSKCRINLLENRILIPVERKEMMVRGVARALFNNSYSRTFVFLQNHELRCTDYSLMPLIDELPSKEKTRLSSLLSNQFHFAEIVVHGSEISFTRFIFEKDFFDGSIWASISCQKLKEHKIYG